MPGQGRVDDRALGIDKHRCNACPHVVSGPATQGSGTVIVNGKPAVRKGDKGKHAAWRIKYLECPGRDFRSDNQEYASVSRGRHDRSLRGQDCR